MWWIRLAALVAVVFGLVTIRSGGTVLFGDEAARAAAGDYVPFVLVFNFGAGFVYVLAGIGLWLQRSWGVWLADALAVATLLVFAAFGVYIVTGGAFEPRTVGAMTVRSAVWVVLAVLGHRLIPRRDGAA